MALVIALSLSFSACGSSSSSETSDTPSKKEQAIALIAEYAKSGTSSPSIEDYADAGAIGVNAGNLDDINAAVLGLTYEDVDTQGEILAIADNLGITISDIIPPTFTSNATASVNENQTSAITLVATDSESAVTYSINSDDASSFSVDPTSGVVTFNTAPDFETKQNYSFNAVATDASANAETQSVSITVLDIVADTTLPTFTSNATASVNENQTSAITLVATDASANAVTQAVSITVLDIVEAATPITHNGVNYLEVTSPYTSKVWLDRNLGASQACTALDDTACYGDYYQWGRNTDGHQASSSATNTTQATDVSDVGHGDFITTTSSNDDWAQTADTDGSLRTANWSKTDGSSVCPVGFRAPTIDEIKLETLNNSRGDTFTNNTDAYNNFLKLPSSGERDPVSGSLDHRGQGGVVWSYDDSNCLSFNSTAYEDGQPRAYGLPIRCIKD